MELEDRAERINDWRELASFIEQFANSLEEDPEIWENDTLERFLRAWAAWLSNLDGYHEWHGQPIPEEPSWRLVAQMMLAARVYE